MRLLSHAGWKPALHLLILLLSTPLHAQLIDKVVCKADPTKSYALYLPSQYDPDRQWPILYCFDARGRGKLAAELFEDGAEKYGYIVASSNDTRSDDPKWPNWEAIKAIWTDTHARFAVHPKRVYAAGFSGGARLACGMGYVFRGSVTGVIGCSGGFHPERPPSKETLFAFFGTAGKIDFNFREMKSLDHRLEELGLSHRLKIFDGNHSWPPKEICTEALEWMELKNGNQAAAFLESIYNKRMEMATSAEKSGKWNEALVEYESIVRDFKSVRDVVEAKEMLIKLNESKEVKESRKQEQRHEREEAEFIQKLRGVIATLESPDPTTVSIPEFAQELQLPRLLERASRKDPTEDAFFAQRLLETAYVQTSFYLAGDLLRRKNYIRAIMSLSLADKIKKDQPAVWYNLACAYALSGNTKKAIEALDHSVASGFSDREQLLKDPDLQRIRQEPAFVELIAKLKNRS